MDEWAARQPQAWSYVSRSPQPAACRAAGCGHRLWRRAAGSKLPPWLKRAASRGFWGHPLPPSARSKLWCGCTVR